MTVSKIGGEGGAEPFESKPQLLTDEWIFKDFLSSLRVGVHEIAKDISTESEKITYAKSESILATFTGLGGGALAGLVITGQPTWALYASSGLFAGGVALALAVAALGLSVSGLAGGVAHLTKPSG